MKTLFFIACAAGILHAALFTAYCVSKRMFKDAASTGVLVAAAAAAAVWLAAVS